MGLYVEHTVNSYMGASEIAPPKHHILLLIVDLSVLPSGDNCNCVCLEVSLSFAIKLSPLAGAKLPASNTTTSTCARALVWPAEPSQHQDLSAWTGSPHNTAHRLGACHGS